MDLEPFRGEIPALGAGVIRSDGIDVAVAGDAEIGTSFHLGSNTKAMTATLAAVAVERGLIEWTSEAAPGLTLERLLAHTAGVRPLTEDEELAGLPSSRSEVARMLAAEPPLFDPGTDTAYSNGGYAIATTMLEDSAGASWETLLQDWLATPLGIELGVGWPELDGHYERDGEMVRHDRSDGYALPPVLAPAGDVNAALGSYARFLQLHLRGLRGRPELISEESFRRLHTPLRDNFALGWGIQPWEGATSSVHAGSAETFFAIAVVQPERDLAVAVVANAGGAAGQRAAVETARTLVRAESMLV